LGKGKVETEKEEGRRLVRGERGRKVSLVPEKREFRPKETRRVMGQGGRSEA